MFPVYDFKVVMPATPVIEPGTHEEEGTADVWKVVVWNDPVNLISYVIWVLRTLFGYSKDKATRLTMQVHNEGKAIVYDGSHAKAEDACFALHRQGLWATLEQ